MVARERERKFEIDQLAIPVFPWGDRCGHTLDSIVDEANIDLPLRDARPDRSSIQFDLYARGAPTKRCHADVCGPRRQEGQR